MYKRVLIGLLAVSMVAVWGTDANANNRVLGVLVKHSDLVLEIELCGDPLVETALAVAGTAHVEIQCKNPGGHVPNGKPGHPTFSFNFAQSQTVPTGIFNNPSPVCAGLYPTSDNNKTAVKTFTTFTVPLPSSVKCKPKWTMVPNSELISVEVTAMWRCTSAEPGSDCQTANETIEAVHVECADTPHTEEGVPCNDVEEHVNDVEGDPPPPLLPDGCVAHSYEGSDYLICQGAKYRDEAIAFCSAHDMSLASIDTEAENTSVVNAAIAAFPDSCQGNDNNFVATSLWISNTLPAEPGDDDLFWPSEAPKFAPGEPNEDGFTIHLLRYCHSAPYGWNNAIGSAWQFGWVCKSPTPG